MGIIKKDSCLVGAMSVMTGAAVCLPYRIIHVLLGKGRPVSLMTAHAESHQIIFEKMFSFSRGMRIVAIDTSFLHRVMLELYFGHSIANILVAIKAEFIPCLQKDEFIF